MSTSNKSQKFILILFSFAMILFVGIFAKTLYQTRKNLDAKAQQVTLVVFTNSYFMSQFGPGPELKTAFEKFCQCTVEYVDVETSVLAIEKMKMDPSRRVDVLLGLDHLLLYRAAQTIRFQEIQRPEAAWSQEIIPFIYPRFIPYDWAPMGFVYREGGGLSSAFTQSKTLQEALKNLPKHSLSLTDPSLSPVGLEFLYWLFVSEGPWAEKLAVLSDKVQSYSPSWSSSYGLFKQGQSQVVWSYLTSLVYHQTVEHNSSYKFLVLQEPHPAQMEYAAVPDSCWNCGDAKKFVEFLTQPDSQKIIAEKNYMLPVITNVELLDAFLQLPQITVVSPQKLDQFVPRESEFIDQWRQSRKN